MMPTAPWLAGPPEPRYNPEADVICADCGYPRTREGTYPCQGSDACTERICEGCKVQCAYCGLPACSEHLKRTSNNDLACDLCIAVDHIETMAEAERHEYAMEKRRGGDL